MSSFSFRCHSTRRSLIPVRVGTGLAGLALALLAACGGESEVTPPPVNPVAPSITTQPQAQTVTAGTSATFSVVVTGTAPLTYQVAKRHR